ncbi:unnamed protein product [Amoebophrya sp. A25]|nr:unnamed protein product [Amoebophrya sp. A25]|eukprot:GSA25T00019061001.1
MDPSPAFRAFSRPLGEDSTKTSTPAASRVLFLEDLSCAMIAVFGFKFKKHDLEMSIHRHHKKHAAVNMEVHPEHGQGESESEFLTESEFLALVAERRQLLDNMTDPLYKQFCALDARSRGQVSRDDLETFLPKSVASQLLRGVAPGKDCFTFQDYSEFLRGHGGSKQQGSTRNTNALKKEHGGLGGSAFAMDVE